MPTLTPGALAIDDRGALAFVNQFDPSRAGVRRFYIVSNHRAGLVRAWHAHRHEEKWVEAISGTAVVCAVKVDSWTLPDSTTKVERLVLSAGQPSLLHIPAGYANGWMSLTEDCRLLWFSSATVEESREDDFRFSIGTWDEDVWKVKVR